MNDSRQGPDRDLKPLFDQHRKPDAAPFKEPETVRLVTTPEVSPTPVTLVVSDPPAQPCAADAKPGAAVDAAFDRSIDGSAPSVEYQTTTALKQGLFGERMAAEGLARQGHQILDYKPDIKGTNQGGFDIVTMKDGIVYLVDNKAYGTGRNVAAVSALDKNFAQNLAATRAKFAAFAADPARSEAERGLYQAAVDAIDGGMTQKAVATAAFAPDGKHSAGVTPALEDKGVIHVDVTATTPGGPAALVPIFDQKTPPPAGGPSVAPPVSAPATAPAAPVSPSSGIPGSRPSGRPG